MAPLCVNSNFPFVCVCVRVFFLALFPAVCVCLCWIIQYWQCVVYRWLGHVTDQAQWQQKKSLRGSYCHFNDFNKQNRKQFFPKTTKKIRQNRNQPEWNSSNLSVLTIISINRIENWSPWQSTWYRWKQNNNPLLQFQLDFNTVESITNQRLLNAWLFNNKFQMQAPCLFDMIWQFVNLNH